MTTDINCSCEIDETGVTVCYPPQNSPGGSGITGVGSVGYLPKILTLVGADGSAIVTVGNSLAYESGGNFWVDAGFSGGSGTQLLIGTAAGGIATIDGVNQAVVAVSPQNAIMQAAHIGSSAVSSVEVNQQDILVLSPNITDETYAYFQTDGMGRFTLRSAAAPGGITLSTPLTGLSIAGGAITSSSTVLDAFGALQNQINGISGGGTTTNALTIGTGLSGTSFNGSAPVTIAIDSTVATLTGSQALTNKTYNGLTVTSSTGTLTVANGTTITMPTATSTVLANSLGLSGGTTLIGGTGATDLVEFRKTSGNQVTGVSNIFKFTSGNNGANELVRFGDGIATNIGEFSAWAAGQSSSTTHMWRAGTNFSYFNAGTDLRLTVGAVSYLNCLSGAGTFAVQKPMTFASGANVTLVAGSTTLAPLVMTNGTYKTAAIAGGIEYNGQFSMTPTDGTRRYVVLAASSTKTTAGAPYTNDGYVTMNINGTDVKVMTTA
ncbi:hypothetical protein [uncultured Flavobacterium sp.]|uniref:hypothetical protein n=1 Tax=uncultured Flavobacterium sp. TaxID=165435 RepID=UPI0025984B48|nr:hypothetical protein [uncultured Flavobacterium sp.]